MFATLRDNLGVEIFGAFEDAERCGLGSEIQHSTAVVEHVGVIGNERGQECLRACKGLLDGLTRAVKTILYLFLQFFFAHKGDIVRLKLCGSLIGTGSFLLFLSVQAVIRGNNRQHGSFGVLELNLFAALCLHLLQDGGRNGAFVDEVTFAAYRHDLHAASAQ